MKTVLWLIACLISAPLVQAKINEQDIKDYTQWRYTNKLQSSIKAYQKPWQDKQYMCRAYQSVINEGGLAYVNGDFGTASRAYGNAIGYRPDPESFILFADLSMRRSLQMIENQRISNQPENSCWNKYRFAYEVNSTLRDYYERAFDLADALKLEKTKASPLFQRGYRSAVCLSKLASHYGDAMSTECVEPDKLKACVSEPLMDKDTVFKGSGC